MVAKHIGLVVSFRDDFSPSLATGYDSAFILIQMTHPVARLGAKLLWKCIAHTMYILELRNCNTAMSNNNNSKNNIVNADIKHSTDINGLCHGYLYMTSAA